VAIGEVGLAGEIRAVTGTVRRLAEAARLGFTHAVVPAGSVEPGQAPAGMRVAQAADLGEAVRLTRPEAARVAGR
jgi:DNA repair protein RadA/Sms